MDTENNNTRGKDVIIESEQKEKIQLVPEIENVSTFSNSINDQELQSKIKNATRQPSTHKMQLLEQQSQPQNQLKDGHFEDVEKDHEIDQINDSKENQVVDAEEQQMLQSLLFKLNTAEDNIIALHKEKIEVDNLQKQIEEKCQNYSLVNNEVQEKVQGHLESENDPNLMENAIKKALEERLVENMEQSRQLQNDLLTLREFVFGQEKTINQMQRTLEKFQAENKQKDIEIQKLQAFIAGEQNLASIPRKQDLSLDLSAIKNDREMKELITKPQSTTGNQIIKKKSESIQQPNLNPILNDEQLIAKNDNSRPLSSSNRNSHLRNLLPNDNLWIFSLDDKNQFNGTPGNQNNVKLRPLQNSNTGTIEAEKAAQNIRMTQSEVVAKDFLGNHQSMDAAIHDIAAQNQAHFFQILTGSEGQFIQNPKNLANLMSPSSQSRYDQITDNQPMSMKPQSKITEIVSSNQQYENKYSQPNHLLNNYKQQSYAVPAPPPVQQQLISGAQPHQINKNQNTPFIPIINKNMAHTSIKSPSNTEGHKLLPPTQYKQQ